MWNKFYDHYLLTVHSSLLGKQHISISGWCSATFILESCLSIWEKNFIVQNSNFQLQYKLNKKEHHPEMLICSLPNKELCTVKKRWSYDLSHILILGTEICNI